MVAEHCFSSVLLSHWLELKGLYYAKWSDGSRRESMLQFTTNAIADWHQSPLFRPLETELLCMVWIGAWHKGMGDDMRASSEGSRINKGPLWRKWPWYRDDSSSIKKSSSDSGSSEVETESKAIFPVYLIGNLIIKEFKSTTVDRLFRNPNRIEIPKLGFQCWSLKSLWLSSNVRHWCSRGPNSLPMITYLILEISS